MPHLKDLWKKKKEDGLILIGVHTKNGGEKMPEFVEAQGIDYPVAVDVDGATVSAYKVNSYPDYYLIDKSGRLRFADLSNRELEKAVDLLIAEES